MAIRPKPKKLDANALWEYALRSLDRRAFSSAQLRKKLGGRAETPEALAEVMKKLDEYGLLNDTRFAETFATFRLEAHKQGARRVLMDLRSKSIPAEVAETAVKQVYSEVDEAELASQYIQKKLRSQDLPTYLKEEKNLASAYRRLRTAGFSHGASIKTLKQFAAKAEELDTPEAPEDEEEIEPTEDQSA
jgi:regulatory protein